MVSQDEANILDVARVPFRILLPLLALRCVLDAALRFK
jgi:hypothetical protein